MRPFFTTVLLTWAPSTVTVLCIAPHLRLLTNMETFLLGTTVYMIWYVVVQWLLNRYKKEAKDGD